MPNKLLTDVSFILKKNLQAEQVPVNQSATHGMSSPPHQQVMFMPGQQVVLYAVKMTMQEVIYE